MLRCLRFVSNFSADGADQICPCPAAVIQPAGPIARRSRRERGLVAVCFCTKQALWVKMESLRSMDGVSEVTGVKQILQK